MKWGKHRLKIFCAIKNQFYKNKQLQIIPSQIIKPKEFSSSEEVKPVSIHKIFMGFCQEEDNQQLVCSCEQAA